MPIGKIIEIEGTDGSGKETQANLLAKKLNNLGIDTVVVSFPDYNSPSSIPVNHFLHGEFGDRDSLTPIEISMLYAFDRSYVYRTKKLQEKINNGTWVIFDRYVGSNIIHNTVDMNSFELKDTIDRIENLEYRILRLPKADDVFYLYMPRELTRSMINSRGLEKDINEKNDVYMSKTVKHGLMIAQKLYWNIVDCRLINQPFSIKTPEQISEEIFYYLSQKYRL